MQVCTLSRNTIFSGVIYILNLLIYFGFSTVLHYYGIILYQIKTQGNTINHATIKSKPLLVQELKNKIQQRRQNRCKFIILQRACCFWGSNQTLDRTNQYPLLRCTISNSGFMKGLFNKPVYLIKRSYTSFGFIVLLVKSDMQSTKHTSESLL